MDIQTALKFFDELYSKEESNLYLVAMDRRDPSKTFGTLREFKNFRSIPFEIQKYLQFLEDQGLTPHIVRNPLKEGSTTYGKDHTKTLNAIVLDLDQTPIDNLNKVAVELNFNYHHVIETSPGKHQIYILINPLEPTDDNIRKFTLVSEAIAKLSSIRDTNVSTNFAGITRVPGTVAIRETGSFKTKNLLHPIFDRVDINTLFNNEQIKKEITYEKPAYQLPKDNSLDENSGRNDNLFRFGCHFASVNPNATDDDLKLALAGFYHTKFTEKGKQTFPKEEYKKIQNQALSYLEKERRKTVVFPNLLPEKEITDTHPASFYLTAPEPLGSMVRYLCEAAPSIPPGLMFIGLETFLSAVLSLTAIDDKDRTPTTLTMAVAPTGSGKSAVGDAIEALLIELGFTPNFLGKKFNSMSRMAAAMDRNNGCLYMPLDEGSDFAQGLISPKAQQFQQAHRDAILEVATKYKSRTWGPTGTKADADKYEDAEFNSRIVPCPRPEILVFIQPESLENALSTDLQGALAKGSLNRFRFIRVSEKDGPQSEFHVSKAVIQNLANQLRSNERIKKAIELQNQAWVLQTDFHMDSITDPNTNPHQDAPPIKDDGFQQALKDLPKKRGPKPKADKTAKWGKPKDELRLIIDTPEDERIRYTNDFNNKLFQFNIIRNKEIQEKRKRTPGIYEREGEQIERRCLSYIALGMDQLEALEFSTKLTTKIYDDMYDTVFSLLYHEGKGERDLVKKVRALFSPDNKKSYLREDGRILKAVLANKLRTAHGKTYLKDGTENLDALIAQGIVGVEPSGTGQACYLVKHVDLKLVTT